MEDPRQTGSWEDRRQRSMNIPGRWGWSVGMERHQAISRSYWGNTKPVMMSSLGWMSLRLMMIPTIPSLTVTEPVTFSSSVRPACLPATTDKTYEGELATVTGWGTLTSGGNQPTVLMEVDVTVTTNELCNNVYGSINDLHI